jgi:diguanylate cyclase (GGDEF)-like protein
VPDAFKILLVDDDVTSIAVLRRALADLGQLRFATSGTDALRLARDSVPDLVLLDVEMPGMTGFEVCAAMKSDPLLHDVPIIFITSHDGIDQEVTGLTLGAADFIAKPLRPALVIARARTQLTMKSMADALRRAATTDIVTGVANRRKFEDALAFEWARATRSRAPLSLLMVDVDFFKAYNDCYGHRAGDDCLKAVASAMSLAVRRATDLLARYGGEEFAVLLPETPQPGATKVVQELLRQIDALALPHPSSLVASHVTVSVGAATLDRVGEPQEAERGGPRSGSPPDLVIAADHALYAAKRAGRHRAHLVQLDDQLDQPALELRSPAPRAAAGHA